MDQEAQNFYNQMVSQGEDPDKVKAYIQAKQNGWSAPPPSAAPAPASPQVDPTIANSSMPNQDNSQWTSGNGLEDFLVNNLPTIGAVGGGIAGEFLDPFGGGLLTSGAGGALGKALQEKIQGKNDIGGILKEGAIDTVTAGAGKLLGLGGKALLSAEGDNLIRGGLNITGKQAAKFATENGGTALNDVLKTNGLTGATIDDLESKIASENNLYGNAINNSNFNIDPLTLEDEFNKATSKLDTAATTDNQALKTQMQNELDNFYQQNGIRVNADGTPLPGQTIPASKLNAFKQAFDAQTSARNFLANPTGYDFNRNMGTIFRNALNKEADLQEINIGGRPLSQLGQNISNLRDIQKLAAARLGASKGLGSMFKQGMAAAVTGATMGNPVIGFMAEPAVEKAAQLAGKPAANVAFKLSNILPSAGTVIGAGVGSAGNALISGPQGNNNNSSYSSNNSQLPSPPGTTNGSTIGSNNQGLPTGVSGGLGNLTLPPLQPHQIPGAYTQDQIQRMLTKAAEGGPTAISAVEAIINANQNQANNYIQTNGLNADEESNLRDAYNTNFLMNRISQQLQNTPPNFLGKFKSYNDMKSYNNGQYAQLATDLQQLQAEVGKQLQGGVLRGYDISVLNITPNLGDSQEEAQAKLQQAQLLLAQRYMNLYPRYGYTTDYGNGFNANQPIPSIGGQ